MCAHGGTDYDEHDGLDTVTETVDQSMAELDPSHPQMS
jgi:cell division protein ZapA (FtsZ GTPase activity inhibitor)